MKCVDEGKLRAYLDNEIDEKEMKIIASHLHECQRCREVLQELQGIDELIAVPLTSYRSYMEGMEFDCEKGWMGFVQRNNIKFKSKGGFTALLAKHKKIISAAAAAALLACSLSFPSVRGMASDFLRMFRVEKFETISFTQEDLRSIEAQISKGVGNIDLKGFGEITASGELMPKEVTLAEAQQLTDFAVKVPEGFEEASHHSVYITQPTQFCFTLDVEKLNSFLASLGGKKLLPEEIDGKTFRIDFHNTVSMSYADKEGKWVSITQMKSPEISVPQGVDVEEIREALLDLPIIPENVKGQLKAVKDWEHTALIPNVGGHVEKVRVNGSQGVLTVSSNGAYATLFWQQDGVIMELNGNLSRDEALRIAASLR